jgi:hypothetical protein
MSCPYRAVARQMEHINISDKSISLPLFAGSLLAKLIHIGTEIIKPCLTPLFHRIDCHTFVAAFSMTSLQISPPPPDVSVDNINGRPASLLVLTRGTSGNSPITFTPSISAVERNMSGEPKSG